MGIFGGLGAGKGWHKLQFLITPDELEHLLVARSLHMMITNRRVPLSYRESEIEEYCSAYRVYVEAMRGARPLNYEVTGPMYVSLAHSLDIINERVIDGEYKSMEPEEPTVYLSPFEVHFYRGTVSTSIGGSDQFSFGLEMTYPKVVSFDREGYEYLHDTSTYPAFALFADLKAAIQTLTSPCRIQSPEKVHRTRIRISPSMREAMASHPGLAAQGLRVV
jgi:hypothetical protein